MANATATRKDIDFSNVKDGGNFNKARIPAGDYLAVITKVEDAESKSDQVFQYLFSIKIVSRPGTVLPYYCKLQENQLWKLRNILIAAGKTVPKRKAKVDPNTIVGKQIGVTVGDTEYDGKDQSEIEGVFPAAELGDITSPDSDDDEGEEPEDEDEPEEDEPEEEPEADEDDEEEADEPVDEDPYADLDRTALKAELKKLDPAFQAKKSQTDDDLRDLLRAAAGEGDEEADEDEEEEPAPAPKTTTRRKTTAASKKKAADVSDEELEEIDIDDI